MAEKEKSEISRTKTKKAMNGHILEQDTLIVKGDDLEEVKKIFDEEWKNV